MNKIETNVEDTGGVTNESSVIAPSTKPQSLNQYALNFYILDKSADEALNLREILQLFNCAISQEQAWAVLSECLNEFQYILENNLELIKLNQDKIDINLIFFVKDGSILFAFDKLPKNTNVASTSSISSVSSEKHTLEVKVLRSIAYLIFDALDYGNNYYNEPDLQASLKNLLLLMSGHYKEFNSNNKVSEDDEGYEQEDEDVISIEKAIEICNTNVPESEYHYRAVCRGLYAQAYELKAFLAKIEHSKKFLEKSGQDTTYYCFEVLDKTDWAKLWMQVIHELRNGVKLRKVCETQELLLRRHIEYELTPFEILLDQIRARRYHLKKVSLDNTIGPELKKDARDIILDFIRSRPPLKSSSKRSLNPRIVRKDEPVNLHEQLMNSIRNYSTPLRKISIDKTNKSLNSTENNSSSNNQGQDTSKHQKKLLKADQKLLSNLTSSDDDDSDIDYDELKNLSILPEDYVSPTHTFTRNNNLTGSLNYSSSHGVASSSSSRNKRRIKAPDSLKSPLQPWCEPVENWRALVTEDILTESASLHATPSSSSSTSHTGNSRTTPTRRHTMNMADFRSISSFFSKTKTSQPANLTCKPIKVSNWKILKSKLTTPVYMKSGPGQYDFCYVDIHDFLKKISNEGNFLSLTFEELCHIRSVLTKAELDYLLFDTQLFQDVSKGKVCFSCRKTKFHLFYWGSKCRICQQRVCKKCLRNAQLKNGQIAQVPLFKLCPNKFSDTDSRNSNSSMNSQTTNEDEIILTSSSNEKLATQSTVPGSKDETILVESDETNYNDGQLFDVCVDCYQMINGVKVSAVSLHLKESLKPKQMQPTSKHLIKRSQTLDSPNDLTMQSLNHLTNTPNDSPCFNKLLASSHHSTPTPKLLNNNISSLILNELGSNDFDLYESRDKRQNLKLDLKPVYSKTSS